MKAKLAFFFLTIIGIAVIFTVPVKAESIRVDSRCSAYLITKPYEDDGDPKCNLTCTINCTQQTPPKSCPYGNPNPSAGGCISLTDVEINEGLGNWNFFGVDFGTPVEAIPRLVRILLTAVFAVIGLVAILLGVYAMYVRSTAGDNAEKAELSIKIVRNAIVGLIISFMGVAIVQLVALLLGLTANLFEFNLIPNPLEKSRPLTTQQALEACEPEGLRGYTIDDRDAILYTCTNGRWVRSGTFRL